MIEIYNINKYIEIYDRKFINTKAHNTSYIYPTDYKADYNQIKDLYNIGYEIMFNEDILSYIPLGKSGSAQSGMNRMIHDTNLVSNASSSIYNPFSYMSSLIKQIQDLSNKLGNITTSSGYNVVKSTSSLSTSGMAASVFDIPSILQMQMTLAQLLFTLGVQIIDEGKTTIENLQSTKIKKENFINSLSTNIKKDIRKLDDLSDILKH